MSFQAMPPQVPVKRLNEIAPGELMRVLRVPSDLPEVQRGEVLRCMRHDGDGTLLRRLDGSKVWVSDLDGSAVEVKPF